MKGLSRGAIAARKLKGVKRDKEHEGYTGSAPCGEGKSLRRVVIGIARVSMTRERIRFYLSLELLFLVPEPPLGHPLIYIG